MRLPLVVVVVALAACTTTNAPSVPSCATFPVPADIQCNADQTQCNWRGTACAVDECGIPPVYPGYAASPQGDTVVIKADQWNALTAWIDDTRSYEACEASRP